MEKKEVIKKLMKEHKEGLTIEELSKKSKLSRNTVVKILAGLEGEGKIKFRQIGQAKLYCWCGK